MTGLNDNQKGRRYEEYIASVYEAKGYKVKIIGASHDGGCDLICRHGCYTVLAQCKYRNPVSGASIDDAGVHALYGFMAHYVNKLRIQRVNEIVSGAFWTPLKDSQCKKAHEAAKDLGIFFYEGVLVYKKSPRQDNNNATLQESICP